MRNALGPTNGEEETDSSIEESKHISFDSCPATNSASRLVIQVTTHAMELEPLALARAGAGKPHRANHVAMQHLGGLLSPAQNKCTEDSIAANQSEVTTSDTETGCSDIITARASMCVSSSDFAAASVSLQRVIGPAMASERKEVASAADESEGDDNDDVSLASGASAADETGSKKSAGSKRKRINHGKPDHTNGRWTPEEHEAFLQGLKIFGREWKKVAERIPTRTSAQIRSHAQKYFSKMQREESILLQDQACSVSSFSPLSQASVPSITDQYRMQPSMLRSVDRILANPHEVQQEVEDTLRNLRERYRHLQQRLEATQRGSPPRPVGRIVEDPPHDELRVPQPRVMDRQKHFAEGAYLNRYSGDDFSSVSSSVSETLSTFSPTRELGQEELIALHVLGGTLQGSTSREDSIMAEASNDDAGMARPGSPASSLMSEDDDNNSSKGKRKHLAERDNEPNTDDDQMMHE